MVHRITSESARRAQLYASVADRFSRDADRTRGARGAPVALRELLNNASDALTRAREAARVEVSAVIVSCLPRCVAASLLTGQAV